MRDRRRARRRRRADRSGGRGRGTERGAGASAAASRSAGALGGERHEAAAIFYGSLLGDPEKLKAIHHEVYGTFGREDTHPLPADVGRMAAGCLLRSKAGTCGAMVLGARALTVPRHCLRVAGA